MALRGAFDDFPSNLSELAVLSLGGSDEELKGFFGAAPTMGHQDSHGVVDGGSRAHGLIEVLIELTFVCVHLGIGQHDRGGGAKVETLAAAVSSNPEDWRE